MFINNWKEKTSFSQDLKSSDDSSFYMDLQTYNTSNFPSPFAGLMFSNSAEDADSRASLFNSMNIQNSDDQNCEDENILFTAKFLQVDTNSPSEESEYLLPSCLVNLMIVDDADNQESPDCNTLEAYTKSFLNASDKLTFQKPAPPPNFNGRVLKSQTDETDVERIYKKLEKIHVSDPEKRRIDLTAALKSRSKTNSVSISTKVSVETKRSVFSYPVQECNIDLSSLADEDLLYSSTSLSPFGYVVCKEWNRVKFPNKYKRLEKIRPYNISRSFKFDTPSPDDCALKNRTRNISVCET